MKCSTGPLQGVALCIVAVLADVVRRMKMLRGARAAIGRKGFDADLKTLANSTYEDFLEAMHISTPKESIVSAANRSDMPPKIRTALRTLLLSTSAVPGTEGRKKKLRHNGHANNLLWGPSSFFNAPNFADTSNPIVKLLHDGPSRDAHLKDYGRCVASSSSTPTPLEGYLSTSAPRMPSLRRMHEIVAANPRAQARFFLLMSELHYRYTISIERLHICRITLARPLKPVQDDVASSLQPSIAPGVTDVQAPLESQARGFTHGHGKGHSVIGATVKCFRNCCDLGNRWCRPRH